MKFRPAHGRLCRKVERKICKALSRLGGGARNHERSENSVQREIGGSLDEVQQIVLSGLEAAGYGPFQVLGSSKYTRHIRCYDPPNFRSVVRQSPGQPNCHVYLDACSASVVRVRARYEVRWLKWTYRGFDGLSDEEKRHITAAREYFLGVIRQI